MDGPGKPARAGGIAVAVPVKGRPQAGSKKDVCWQLAVDALKCLDERFGPTNIHIHGLWQNTGTKKKYHKVS